MADGSCLITVMPWYPMSFVFGVNAPLLPFVSVATGSSTLPFAVTPGYSPAGPFNPFVAQASLMRTDSLTCSYIHTQS